MFYLNFSFSFLKKLNSYGYSIMELIIVIAIITFLITGAVFNYFQYKDKASLMKSALSYGKSCIVAILNYCNNHPNESINLSSIAECQNTTLNNENVYLQINSAYQCNGDTIPVGLNIKVYTSSSNSYYIECTYDGKSIYCQPKPR